MNPISSASSQLVKSANLTSCAPPSLDMPHFTISSAAGRVSILNPVTVQQVYSNDPALAPAVDMQCPEEPHKHQCFDCVKFFTTSGHLVRHKRIHSGTKDFVCPFHDCFKSCSRQDNMTQHYRVHLPSGDRKESNMYVRARITEMRLNMEKLAPLPQQNQSSSSPVFKHKASLKHSISGRAAPASPLTAFAAISSLPRLVADMSQVVVSPKPELSSRAVVPRTPTPLTIRRPPFTRFSPYERTLLRYEPSESSESSSMEDSPMSAEPSSPRPLFSPQVVLVWPPVCATLENSSRYRISYARAE